MNNNNWSKPSAPIQYKSLVSPSLQNEYNRSQESAIHQHNIFQEIEFEETPHRNIDTELHLEHYQLHELQNLKERIIANQPLLGRTNISYSPTILTMLVYGLIGVLTLYVYFRSLRSFFVGFCRQQPTIKGSQMCNTVSSAIKSGKLNWH